VYANPRCIEKDLDNKADMTSLAAREAQFIPVSSFRFFWGGSARAREKSARERERERERESERERGRGIRVFVSNLNRRAQF
jgi:hypothetical protein